MKTLVIGGTGTIGRLVVDELVQQNVAVRVLITSPDQATLFPKGVETVVGHLEQPATLPKAFNDIDTVALLNQRCPTEGAQGQYAIAAAKRAGVRKMVYLSQYKVRRIPHLKAKVIIENVLTQTGMEFVMICPTLVYQNDLIIGSSIASYGIPPQVIDGMGVNRVDARDVADATVKAILTDEFNGLSIPLVGPQSVRIAQPDERFSSQPLASPNNSGTDQSLATWLVEDWRKTYQCMLEEGLQVSTDDVAFCTDVLARAPRSYADFLADHAPAFQPNLELA
ncbi:SDR family oxidoreductase [Spirosoma aerolatum]|uniref:SDR family oxidoreductase n=1 Tax=Spirosoma aerolatum TaxID=1211326 RepID=UPI0009AC4EBD|nr:NAD(P)H-binding protein [Spirosoma aerolatum]